MKCKCGERLSENRFGELFRTPSTLAEHYIGIIMDETEKGCCRESVAEAIIGMIKDLEYECDQLIDTLENHGLDSYYDWEGKI